MNSVAVSAKRKLPTDDQILHPRKCLRIEIPCTLPTESTISATTSPSSLFSAAPSHSHNDVATPASPTITTIPRPASRVAPPIPGLYFIPTLEIPPDLADSVMSFCMSTYFRNPDINQIMLFTRFSPQSTSSLPSVLLDLLGTVSGLLRPHIPDDMYDLLFPKAPTQARQVIINLYTPGEGISPHVDLLKRFGDGIIGVSLGSGCVMRFAKASSNAGGEGGQPSRTSILDNELQPLPPNPNPTDEDTVEEEDSYCDLYLPERSILVLSSDARYKWTHGIEKRKSDFVSQLYPALSSPQSLWLDRGIRLSVTFRWLLPGADVVGGDEESDSESP